MKKFNIFHSCLVVLVIATPFWGACDDSATAMPGINSDADSDTDTDSDSDTDTNNDTISAELVSPIERDGSLVLEMAFPGNIVVFACTEKDGGRITEFSIGGENILVEAADNEMFGSTFWTSPQNWGWPPPLEMDADNYTADVDEKNGIITLTSDNVSALDVRITKQFSANLTLGAIELAYTIENTGSSTIELAPWEITRVASNSATFYQQGDKLNTGEAFGNIDPSIENDIVWIEHPDGMTESKIFDDSTDGWIAHTNGDLLFIKSFEESESFALNEAEIEIYAKGDYVEVEQQGTNEKIAAGDSITWNVRWFLVKPNASFSLDEYSGELVDYVKDTI